MSSKDGKMDYRYAVEHTQVVHAPSRALETFGATRVNYSLVAELPDDPRKIRIREGRLEAHKPAIITPEEYAQDSLEGFGDEAQRYYDYLKKNEDRVKILQYGYNLKQEAFSEQVVSGSVPEVLERVVKGVREGGDPFSTVILGVDDPWDVCLLQFFWMHVNASAPVNLKEMYKAGMFK